MSPSLITLFGLVVVIAIIIAFAMLVVRRRRMNVKLPSCAICLYPVVGLEGETCPECGSDLNEVGIVTPDMRRPMHPVAVIIVWTVLLPLPATIITFVVGDALEFHRMDETISLSMPDSKTFQRIEIATSDRIANSADWSPDSFTFILSLKAAPLQRSLHYSAHSGDRIRAELPDGSWAEWDEPVDAATLSRWFAAHGIDTTRDDVKKEIAEIEVLYQEMTRFHQSARPLSARTFSGIGTSINRGSAWPVWYGIAAPIFWALVWVAVIMLIVRRCRNWRGASPSSEIFREPSGALE